MSIGAVGLGSVSLWSTGPKIAQLRPNVETAKKYLEDVKYTPGDISNMMFESHVPDYSPLNLSPRIPKVSVKANFQPVQVPEPTANAPSTTATMMSRARGMLAYKGI